MSGVSQATARASGEIRKKALVTAETAGGLTCLKDLKAEMALRPQPSSILVCLNSEAPRALVTANQLQPISGSISMSGNSSFATYPKPVDASLLAMTLDPAGQAAFPEAL